MSLKQPVTQKRLTNIAVVRLRSHGVKFEIACYKNKVLNWRAGLEKDLNEVLQTFSIFSNVSQGVLAKEKDIKKAFGDLSETDICVKILEKGELQVSDKERSMALDSLNKDLLTILTRRCINPETGRPLTLGMAESALKQSEYVVRPNIPAKRQALKAIDHIVKKLPGLVAKANMRLCMQCPVSERAATREKIEDVCSGNLSLQFGQEKEVVADDGSPALDIYFVCDPYFFRELDRLQGCNVRVIEAQVVREGDANLDDELLLRLDDDLDALLIDDDIDLVGTIGIDSTAPTPHSDAPSSHGGGMLRVVQPPGGSLFSNNRGPAAGTNNTKGEQLTSVRLSQHNPNPVVTPGSVPGGVHFSEASSGRTGVNKGGAGIITPKSTSSFQHIHEQNSTPSGPEHPDWVVVSEAKILSSSVNNHDTAGGGIISSPSSPETNDTTKSEVDGSHGDHKNNACVAQGPITAITGTCTTCGPYTEENIRVHMKTAWHQCNVQRKCAKQSIFTLEEYRDYEFDKQFLEQHMGEGNSKEGGKKKKKK